MDAEAARARVPPAAVVLGAALAILSLAVVTGKSPGIVAPVALLVAVLAAAHRTLLRWEVQLAGIVLCVLFVPITRYTLPGSLPFKLELYRLLVAAVLLCWVASMLIDSRVRIRRTAFDAPILLLVLAIFASELANPGRVESVDSYVTKGLISFLGFVFVYYFVTSTIVRRSAIEFVLGLLVGGGAVVALAAAVERRTGYNVFWDLGDVLPFLNFQGAQLQGTVGRLRVSASAEHPIALGALFALLLPIGVGLARRRGRIWWVPTASLAVGAMAAASRTPIIMLVAAAGIFLWLKPRETVRLLPLAVPAVVIVHAVVPGTIGTIRTAFFPPGGLVAQQSRLPENADPLLAGGRIRLLGPSIDIWAERPLVGQGYATRVTGFSEKAARNAPILDNQWLDTLLETGALGAGAWLWIFARAGRRLGRSARDGPEGDDWLFTSLAASIVSFSVGMFFYDTFSFIQVTFVFWILLGLAAAALRLHAVGTLDAAERIPDSQR